MDFKLNVMPKIVGAGSLLLGGIALVAGLVRLACGGEAGTAEQWRDVIENGPQQGMHSIGVAPGVVVVQLADQPQELGPVELVCSLLSGDGGDHLGVDVGTGQGLGALRCRWRPALDPAREQGARPARRASAPDSWPTV